MAGLLSDPWPTVFSLALLASLVGGVIGYARARKPSPARAEVLPTLIPADSTDFAPSTIVAPIATRRPREFEDSE